MKESFKRKPYLLKNNTEKMTLREK
jgi:hypothetical protein